MAFIATSALIASMCYPSSNTQHNTASSVDGGGICSLSLHSPRRRVWFSCDKPPRAWARFVVLYEFREVFRELTYSM